MNMDDVISRDPVTSPRKEHREGTVAQSINKMSNDWFLWAALGSIGVSATLQGMGKRHASLFVGQWAPSFMLLGIYNKMVQLLGSERR